MPSRKEAGLPEPGFVFCCFNNHWKIMEPLFEIWMRLLQAVPDSKLWLIDETVTDRLRAEAQARGVDGGRLIFAPKVRQDMHLARLSLADLMLDTLPYNAPTTGSDALWAGGPLVTCRGKFLRRPRGRKPPYFHWPARINNGKLTTTKLSPWP